MARLKFAEKKKKNEEARRVAYLFHGTESPGKSNAHVTGSPKNAGTAKLVYGLERTNATWGSYERKLLSIFIFS